MVIEHALGCASGRRPADRRGLSTSPHQQGYGELGFCSDPRGAAVLARMALVIALLATTSLSTTARERSNNPEERWPVCGEWRGVPVDGGSGDVNDIAVVSSTDAWIIVDEGYEFFNRSFIYRWDGLRWSKVAIPEPTTGDIPFWELTALGVVSPTEIWAVGYEVRYDTQATRPISARWNGRRWRWVHIETPHLRAQLQGLAVVPGTHRLWAVGFTHPGSHHEDRRTFVLVWNGMEWRRVRSPSPGRWSEYLDVVSVGGSTWAVGTMKPEGSAARLLASKWTGHGWTVHQGPRGYVEAVDGLGARDLWAVGWNWS